MGGLFCFYAIAGYCNRNKEHCIPHNKWDPKYTYNYSLQKNAYCNCQRCLFIFIPFFFPCNFQSIHSLSLLPSLIRRAESKFVFTLLFVLYNILHKIARKNFPFDYMVSVPFGVFVIIKMSSSLPFSAFI